MFGEIGQSAFPVAGVLAAERAEDVSRHDSAFGRSRGMILPGVSIPNSGSADGSMWAGRNRLLKTSRAEEMTAVSLHRISADSSVRCAQQTLFAELLRVNKPFRVEVLVRLHVLEFHFGIHQRPEDLLTLGVQTSNLKLTRTPSAGRPP